MQGYPARDIIRCVPVTCWACCVGLWGDHRSVILMGGLVSWIWHARHPTGHLLEGAQLLWALSWSVPAHQPPMSVWWSLCPEIGRFSSPCVPGNDMKYNILPPRGRKVGFDCWNSIKRASSGDAIWSMYGWLYYSIPRSKGTRNIHGNQGGKEAQELQTKGIKLRSWPHWFSIDSWGQARKLSPNSKQKAKCTGTGNTHT